MALVISTGFVVDDAIVMIENIARFIKKKPDSPMQAALEGRQQIGFTIISLTLSLLAVLIPLLFMGDVVGRLFHEFAITLAVAILISAVVSLTLTPDDVRGCCAPSASAARVDSAMLARRFDALVAAYGRSLTWVLDRPRSTLGVFALTLGLTGLLYVVVPKGFFPVQDTGLIQVITEATQTTSFGAMATRQQVLADAILKDPDVNISPPSSVWTAQHHLEHRAHADHPEAVRAARGIGFRGDPRLAEATSRVPGITAYMQPVQDLTIEDRVSKTQYQFLLSSPDAKELATSTHLIA
jgi:multidrug efflux pump